MRIEVIHNYDNEYQWDIFYVQLIDDNKPDGQKIRASASGEWSFITRVVSDWLREYISEKL